MKKTKRQLRAEAVERLKNSEYHTALDDICSMLGWGHEPHFEGATDALIDLLTDDDANDELRAENDVRANDVDANDANGALDSREKLEADVRKVLQSAYMYAWMHGNENRRGCSFEKLHREFYNLLDRQASITERECRESETFRVGIVRDAVENGEEVNVFGVPYAPLAKLELEQRLNKQQAQTIRSLIDRIDNTGKHCPFNNDEVCAGDCSLLVQYAEWSDEKHHMEQRRGCALAVSGKPVNYYVSEDDDG